MTTRDDSSPTRAERMQTWLIEHAAQLELAAKMNPALTRQCAIDALRCLALAEMAQSLQEDDATLDLPADWWTETVAEADDESPPSDPLSH